MRATAEWNTVLIGSVDDLNNEREHRYIGLRWAWEGGDFWIETKPRPDANMANGRGVSEEIQRHLKQGGVTLVWPYRRGETTYVITPSEILEK